MRGKFGAHLIQHAVAVGGVDLIRLGQHALKGHGGGVEERHDLFIHGFDAVARIDQHKGAAQGLAT